MPKKRKWFFSLGFFNIHSVANIKNIEGKNWKIFFDKKVAQYRKTLKGGPFSVAQYCMLRGKKEKLFGSVR